MNKKVLEEANKNLHEVQLGMRERDMFPETELERMVEVIGVEIKKMCQRSKNRIELIYEYANGSLLSLPRVYIKIYFNKDGEVKELKINKKKCFRRIGVVRIVNHKEFTGKELRKIVCDKGIIQKVKGYIQFCYLHLSDDCNKILKICKIK